jgi:hypothetical protein
MDGSLHGDGSCQKGQCDVFHGSLNWSPADISVQEAKMILIDNIFKSYQSRLVKPDVWETSYSDES